MFFVNSKLKYLQKYLVCAENLPATSHGSDLIVLLAAHCQNDMTCRSGVLVRGGGQSAANRFSHRSR